MRVLGVGTPKAKRLAMRAGWVEPTATADPDGEPPARSPGQLALVHEPHDPDTDDVADVAAESDDLRARTSR
jgi:hypothetical protein